MDAVLNWSTQGVVLGLIAAAGLRVVPGARTRTRHSFLWTAYLSLLSLPVAAPILTLTRNAAGLDAGPEIATPLLTVPAAGWTSTAVIVGLWSVWFAAHALLLVRDVAAVHHAKRQGQACPRDLLARLPHWSRVSETGRRTSVVLSNRVRAAGVLGCGAPVVVVAPHLIEELSATDLDRVLVHEWAHVQRRDDLAHMGQRLVRALVGWHPAAWWIERQLEFEREIACDEIAVGVTGSAKRYAQCLVTIAALKHRPARTLPVLAAVSRSRLRRRVERIVAVPSTAVMPPWRALAFISIPAVVACALALSTVQVVSTPATFAVATIGTPASARAAGITTPPPQASSLAPTASVSGSVQARKRRASAPARLTAPETGAPEDVVAVHRSEEQPPTPIAKLPVQWMDRAAGTTLSARVASPASELAELASVATRLPSPSDPAGNASAGWARAADVGVSIGRVSQTAGVATAGFFTRFGKKVAASF